jgi:hypothetical protein
MTDAAIDTAIKAFTDHARAHSGFVVSDISAPLPTARELVTHRSDIEAICKEMDALAHDPNSRFSDFERLRQKRTDFPATPPALLDDVARAFESANRL